MPGSSLPPKERTQAKCPKRALESKADGDDLYATRVSESERDGQSQGNEIHFQPYFPGSCVVSHQKFKLFTESRFPQSSAWGL